MFSEKELAYLKTQRLAHIATVSADLQPDVAAVSYEFDGERFFVSGRNVTGTLKYRNVRQGRAKVALVVDDLETVDGKRYPRGLKLHGRAEIVERDGHFGYKPYLQITPEKSWSWGIERPAFDDGKPVFNRNTK